jgi:hypothetical protein
MSSTESFQQQGRWQRQVAALHDLVVRARVRERPRLTFRLRTVRGVCAADVATTALLTMRFRGIL